MRTRLLLFIPLLFSYIPSVAQDISSDRIWNDYLKAVNADYVANMVGQIDVSISRLYDRLDSKYSEALVESTKKDISDIYDNKFITDEQKSELDKLDKLISDYKNQAEAFKSVFIQEIDDPMVNNLLKLENIVPEQVVMMAAKFWSFLQTDVNELSIPAEYKYLNTRINRVKVNFKQIISRDPDIIPESYMDILQETLKIESELVEGHTHYFKLR